jgi:EmrB/QacA subfamily drug resistance transporter
MLKEEQVKYSRKWLVMAAVAGGIFLSTIDGSIVNIALPVLERDLHTEFAIVQWVVLAYLLTITTLMMSIGRLGDMFGKKPIYLAGFIIFTLGSVLCGLANHIGWLIACRVLQAAGGVMMMALGTAIITEAFPPEERGKALGIGGLMVSIGAISGPTVGGIILGSLSWHWIFFVNIPVGIVGVMMVIWFVPDLRPSNTQKFDFYGAGCLFVSLFGLLMGMTLGQSMGFTALPVLGLLGLFIVFLILFLHVERQAQHPMIDLDQFSDMFFSVNLITGFLTFVCSAGIIMLMPFFLENILGYEPWVAGMMMVTVPLAMGIVAPLSGFFSDRYGSRRLTVIGLIVLLGGYIAVSTLHENLNILGYVLRFLPIGIGMGLFQSPNNSAIMGSASRQRLGVVSGLLALTRNLGQTSGIAIIGTVWASMVRVWGGSATDTTSAPAAVQVAAFHTTIYVVIGVITSALLLSLWALWRERQVNVPEISVETRL